MKVTMLAGGTAGAKLALGSINSNDEISIVVNVGDDGEELGLYVSPDIDSIVYSCAGFFDFARNWGIKNDTFNAFNMLERLGEKPSMMLGDMDIAIHLLRSLRLGKGERLTQITKSITSSLGVKTEILPATDQRLTTIVDTDIGTYTFEEYYLQHSKDREIRALTYMGSNSARATPEVISALGQAELVIITPSNPVASIWPIISVQDIRREFIKREFQVIAISPFIGGHAIKGPAEEMMKGVGLNASTRGVAKLYRGLIDKLVIDITESELAEELKGIGFSVFVENTLMSNSSAMAAFYKRLREIAKL